MSLLSKLSLSKNKAAAQKAGTPQPASALRPRLPSQQNGAAAQAQLQLPPPPPQQQQRAGSADGGKKRRRPHEDDDSGWSSSNSEGGRPAQAAPTAAGAGAAAGSTTRGAVGPPGRGIAHLLPPQRPAEIYMLDASSSDDDDDWKQQQPAQPPRTAAATPASRQPKQQARQTLTAGPTPLPHPQQQQRSRQPASCQQPQHRKHSFDREGAATTLPAAAPALPPAGTGAQHAAAIAAGGGGGGQGSPPLQAGSGQGQAAGEEVPPEYVDVHAWLKGLGQERYIGLFVAEELDMTIVHTLTSEDLASIGITHRAHQQAIVSAAQQLAAARRGASWPAPAAVPAVPAAAGGRPPQPPAGRQQAVGSGNGGPRQPVQKLLTCQGLLHPQQQLQQPAVGPKARAGRGSHQSLLQVWQANAAAAASGSGQGGSGTSGSMHSLHNHQQQRQSVLEAESNAAAAAAAAGAEGKGASLASLGSRPAERDLFACLYPAPAGGAAPGAVLPATVQLLQRSTAGAAAGAARVPAYASIWAAAGECRQVAPSLQDRLSRRRAEAGLEAAPTEQLARGGTAYPQVEESRALKLMKLEALKQERSMHEETVAELSRAIAAMEAELGLG